LAQAPRSLNRYDRMNPDKPGDCTHYGHDGLVLMNIVCLFSAHTMLGF
jgi:hypothetical protein